MMQKTLSRVLAVMMVLVLTLVLASCSNGKANSIKDYINSDEVQSQLASLKKAAEGSGMNIDVLGEDNKLIYTYTFPEGTATDGLADALDSGLDSQASTFENIASALKEAVNVENPVVVVKYLASDGSEILVREFNAK